MSKGALLEMAARVEAATGADRELDALVWCAVNEVEPSARIVRDFEHGQAIRYTASLDAAMTLIPDDWPRTICDHRGLLGMFGWASVTANSTGQITVYQALAATPALALCAAALRARATSGGDAPNQSGKEG